MSDLAYKYKNGFFELQIAKNDLVMDDGLESAVIVSLWTDQRVTIEELPFGETDRAGWWGDLFNELDEVDPIGSKLWVLIREKQTESTRTRIIEYCQKALAWMVEDSVADSVTVDATFPSRGVVAFSIAIQKPQGKVTFKYIVNWNTEAGRGE